MRVLGLIPARGGSKGVPRKNIKLLGGQPLINYSIASGLACPLIEQVVVSTDDEEIAQISREAGANVPFMRPAKLASDKSPTIDTVVHALQFFLDHGELYEAVCLLQPTVPFRDARDLTAAVQLFVDDVTDSLISVREVPHVYHPHWVYKENVETGYLEKAISDPLISRRQDLPPAYHRDGSVYISNSGVILKEHSLYGQSINRFVMAHSPNINIDTMEDWEAAEQYVNTHLNQ
ncbi:MAG: acylneuraminate cytidylyltransferase family protein [Bacteroidota bacterium]